MTGGSLPPVPRSVVHMLLETADAFPDRPAVTFGEVTLSYAEYRQAVLALAAMWRQMIRPGERIALLLSNSLDMAVSTFAAHAAGAQAVPLNPAYTLRELTPILDDAAPRLLVHEAGLAADLVRLCGARGISRIETGGGGATFLGLAEGPRQADPRLVPSHGQLATLQYTGGTTGLPKGVDITHGQLAVNLAQREALLPTERGGEVMLCSMPLFHVSAVAMCLHLACYAASHLVILPRYRPDWVLEAIGRHRATLMSAGPTIFHGLLGFEGFGRADLGSLRCCYSGAAALPEATLQRWEAASGCVILEGYGMTEAGPVLTYNPARGPRKVGSVGVAVPASELQIVDPERDGTVLPAGAVGEIRVRGRHVMAGYRNRPELSEQALAGGWFHTGDLGRLDGDGYLFITGRRSEVINVGGYNVYPREVEQVLLEHPAVAEAAVFGAADDYYGQVVQAYVVPRGGARLDEQALIEHCRSGLVRYKVPRAVRSVDSLPKTSVGKLARRLLEPIGSTAAGARPAAAPPGGVAEESSVG
ncbi:long-chain acyl-CoA synthetase [Tistlia consotensis]|uniref:Long-chain acyl-CoA synthetase n=1 Tax=Tistlia consotensis USBA 355 TaxID=560819 RepID=A0A1Y6B492_9PROT|nr:AMP-binding protein [Tistlia consotensis]SME91133.1 long-chain acyl-CoA synthetase [Tistlia consotensis USBA 355]SNR27148.1 long-chain acyl-CoA synthetase [Tistlia consotensis]